MVSQTELISNSNLKTKEIGKLFGQSLKEGVIISLVGDLGGGKTTFVQGLGMGLGIRERITSPSFVLMKRYKVNAREPIKYLCHIDCYRLEKAQDILGIGYREIIKEKDAVIVIEWANRIKKYLPKKRIKINFEFIDQNQRKILIAPC